MSADKALPKGLPEGKCKKGKKQETYGTILLTPVNPILDSVENKPGTNYYKISLPDGTMVYHANYDNGSNKKKGFYKSYKKDKTNFEDDTSILDLDQQKNLTMPTLNFGSIFGFLK